MRRRLPPLNALRAFEAAGRAGGFAAAGRELGVSAPAVSQQVRALEAFYAKALFHRAGNRLTLTDAGARVYAEAAAALDRVEALTARLLDEAARADLVVSMPPSLAAKWMPGIAAGLAERGHEIGLDLRVAEDPVDFAREGIDLRVTYGGAEYADLARHELLTDRVTALMAPGFLARHGGAGEVLRRAGDGAFIHTVWGPRFASHPGWDAWMAAAGEVRRPAVKRGQRVELSSLAIDLAAAGAGIALGQLSLARGEIARGALVAPFEPSLPLAAPYVAVHAHARAGRPGLRAVLEVLRALGAEAGAALR